MSVEDRKDRLEGKPYKVDASKVDFNRLPRHVAIIVDGNGRWAQKKGIPRSLGYREGMKTVHRIVQIASDMGIEVLTLYAFSTENWKRPEKEVRFLMDLLVEFLIKELDELHSNGARIAIIGDYRQMPKAVVRAIDGAVAKTKDNPGLIVNIALNYGGRNELVHAVRAIAAKVKEGRLETGDIDEETLSQALYTRGIVDPDLVVRTSGEMRLSNFLLYQAAYAELYFTPVYWPDFSEQDFVNMIVEYQGRNRRFGGL